MAALVEQFKDGVYCDSSRVAKKFGRDNGYVVVRINQVIEDIGELRVNGVNPKVYIEDRVYRGTPYQAYLMNRDFFSFLVMRFKGKKAVKWQLEFIAAFNAMENMILQEMKNKGSDEWILNRDQGKIIRLEETDAIKEFVDYATAQGSQSAKFYYKHVTHATYKALGFISQRKPKLRNTLAMHELHQLSTAEQLVKRSFKGHMIDELPYKAVYKHVIADLEQFSDSLKLDIFNKRITNG